jgi:hypothetical protein
MHDADGVRRERQHCVEAGRQRNQREVEGDERGTGAEPAADAEPDGQAHRFCGRARERRMPRLLHHLEQQKVHAGLGERLGKLAVRGHFAALVGIGVRIEARRQARDRPRNGHLSTALSAGFARRSDGAIVELLEMGVVPRGGKHKARGREGVGRDDVGAGRNVVGMDRAQELVMRQRREGAPGGRVERDAAAAKLGARTAVEQ